MKTGWKMLPQLKYQSVQINWQQTSEEPLCVGLSRSHHTSQHSVERCILLAEAWRCV